MRFSRLKRDQQRTFAAVGSLPSKLVAEQVLQLNGNFSKSNVTNQILKPSLCDWITIIVASNYMCSTGGDISFCWKFRFTTTFHQSTSHWPQLLNVNRFTGSDLPPDLVASLTETQHISTQLPATIRTDCNCPVEFYVESRRLHFRDSPQRQSAIEWHFYEKAVLICVPIIQITLPSAKCSIYKLVKFYENYNWKYLLV